MTPMPTDLMIGLRDIFTTYFNEEDLKDFALDLGVDYENLSGSNKNAKARELALYLGRHSLLPQLAVIGPKRRPNVDWSILGPHIAPDTTSGAGVPKPQNKLDYTDLQKLVPILAAYSMFQTPDSRNTLLVLAGVSAIVNLDLNGNAQFVASTLLVKLNEYGEIGPGDTAVGRLLAYVSADAALPPAHKEAIAAIAAKYGITLE